MQEILWRLRHRQAAAPIVTDFFLVAELLDFTVQRRRYAALARPTILCKTCLKDTLYPSPQGCFETTRPSFKHHARPRPSVQLLGQSTKRGLGQLRGYHGGSRSYGEVDRSGLQSRGHLQNSAADEDLREVRYWERRVLKAQAKHGPDGVLKLFKLFQQKRFAHLLVHLHADGLRDRFLASVLDDDIHLAKLVSIARELRVRKQFTWPNLYEKILHSFLSRAMYSKALAWHWHLAPDLLPTADMFGLLLADLATRDDPEMQTALESLYTLQIEHKLYDHMIPTLYRTGRSKQARIWRRKLLNYRDYPTTPKSLPFLRFLQQYYPQVQLTAEELAIARHDVTMGQRARPGSESVADKSDAHSDTYSDPLVAKWLATQWMPLDFAMNFVLNLGLRTMGPRSLQSLALRETNAKGVAERVATLEKRGIEITRHVYCEALVHFARNGDDDLLTNLLSCDIHHNEFDDSETRRMLLSAALKRGDTKQASLLRGIDRAIRRAEKPFTLVTLLEKDLDRGDGRNFRWALQRMKELNIPLGQNHAKRFLQHAFKDMPLHSKQLEQDASQLTAAIDTMRVISRHDVAIPVWCWRKLLNGLGRAGRLGELEQLSLEIVDLYRFQYREMIPVHHDDLPGTSNQVSRSAEQVPRLNSGDAPFDNMGCIDDLGLMTRKSFGKKHEFGPQPDSMLDKGAYVDEQTGVPGENVSIEPDVSEHAPTYIPADLEFSHHEHPLHKIFDTSLQRSIIRWGFDQTLAQRPRFSHLQSGTTKSMADFDVARGVRLLALLRDQGLVVHKDLVRAAVLVRIALNQVPGRLKNHARDSHELSMDTLKRLFDDAWGSELLPQAEELLNKIERQKLQTWSRYPKLLSKTYDDEYDNTNQAADSQ